ARCLAPADTDLEECRSTRAETAGALTLPAKKSLRILSRARSRALLRHYCRRPPRRRRLLVHQRILVDVRFNRAIGFADGFGMTKEEISARLQVFIKALDQLRLALVRKINQDVHAKDAVEFPHVDHLGQVHGSKRDHVADSRLDHVMIVGPGKILLALTRI